MASYDELLPCVGRPVRVRGDDRSRHLMPAMLVAVDEKRAEVIPFGRSVSVLVPLDDVRVWKSGLARWEEMNGRG